MATVYNVLDTRDKQELTEKIDADKNELSKTIQNTKTELQSNIDALESQHDEDKTDLQTQIDSLESIKADKTEITAHNTSNTAHNDIRLLIQNLTTKLNTIADSDDSTLDQMSEIVEYIKNNKELIDSITTTKVSVSDIINNLVTNVTNKPLSAAMGVELKALIDAIPDTTLATVNEKILEHNVSADAHEDIRNDIVSVQSDATAAQTTADAAQALANNAQDDADEALQRLNSLEVGSGKIDRIVETTNGVAVCADPLIGVPLVGATVYGSTRQNLWVNPTRSTSGVSVTGNPDGSMTLAGTNETDETAWLGYVKRYTLRPGSTYTLSTDHALPEGVAVRVETRDASNAVIDTMAMKLEAGTNVDTGVIQDDAAYVHMIVTVESGATASGTYRIMLNEGSTAEPWCPPGLNGVDELSVVCAGKNLLKNPQNDIVTSGGLTFTKQPDGGVVINGTSGASPAYYNFFDSGNPDGHTPISALAGKSVVISCDGMVGGINLVLDVFLDWALSDRVTICSIAGGTLTGILPDNATYLRPFISVAANTTLDNVVVYPQVEVGSTATDYEPPQVTTTPIDLSGHTLSSLPDGTRDELSVDATGAVTLTQRVGVIEYAADDFIAAHGGSEYVEIEIPDKYAGGTDFSRSKQMSDFSTIGNVGIARGYPETSVYTEGSRSALRSGTGVTESSVSEQLANLKAMLGTKTWHHLYKLAEPQIIYLGTIDSPALPAQTSHIWFSSNIPVNDFSVRYWLPNGELVEELYRTGATEEISDNEIISIWNGATGDIIEATNADIEAIFE